MADFPEPGPRRGATVATPPDDSVERMLNHVAGARRFQKKVDDLGAGKPEKTTATVVRPKRFHANAKQDREERRFDKTALHYEQHGKLISHADYIAHVQKYDYVWRSIKMGDRILDVGCGTDTPLMRAINFVQSQAAKVLTREGGAYVGVDLNQLKPTNISWAQLIGEVDMTSESGYEVALRAINPDSLAEPRGYSLIVALEVIEHMDKEDGASLLVNMRDLLSSDGRIILSTPVFDGKAMARNHIHEYFFDELKEAFASADLRVDKVMGTFTSEPVIKRWMKQHRPDWLALYMESREFHSSGYLSGLIAPMVPELSRNCVWVLRRLDG